MELQFGSFVGIRHSEFVIPPQAVLCSLAGMTNAEILDLFRSTGALLHGHFVLRSGLHSREFFQCAILLERPRIAERVCAALAEKLQGNRLRLRDLPRPRRPVRRP